MKQNILDIALKIIERKGADAISMRILAQKSGLSTMAAYRHFSCKDELLLEVAAKGFDCLVQQIDKSALNEKDPLRKMEAVLNAYFQFGLENKNLFQLMFGPLKKKEELSASFRKAVQSSFLKFNSYVTALVEVKIKKELFPFQTSDRLWAFIHGTTILEVNGFLSTPRSSNQEIYKKVQAQIKQLLKDLTK